MNIRMIHLYPDVLNLYGDSGNVLCMKRRLEWRGLTVEVTEVPLGERLKLSDADLVFLGGGQDFDQTLLLSDLSGEKAGELRCAIEDGLPVLAICGGYQMLGQSYQTHVGAKFDCSGVLDLYTVGAPERMVGNIKFVCGSASGGSTVVGFENHSGKTYLGSGISPLGTVISGFGNNGEDCAEGVRYKNVFGSYCHGPVLPKNPSFCDRILSCALERKYGNGVLEPLDDTLERLAHKETEMEIQR